MTLCWIYVVLFKSLIVYNHQQYHEINQPFFICHSPRWWHEVTHAVWAAPGALWCLLHIWVQADHVIGSWAGVAENDLSALLTDLTVVLMIRFIAITLLICYDKDIRYLTWSESVDPFTSVVSATQNSYFTVRNPKVCSFKTRRRLNVTNVLLITCKSVFVRLNKVNQTSSSSPACKKKGKSGHLMRRCKWDLTQILSESQGVV